MSLTHFDFANYLSDIQAIIKDVQQYDGSGTEPTAFGYFLQPSSNRARGFYYDLWGGGAHLLQYAPSVDPNGNTVDWEANKVTLSTYLRTQMRDAGGGNDSAFYQTTEAPEEHLIPAFDAVHLGTFGTLNDTYGGGTFLYSVVYSRFQCLLDLSVTLNTTATAPTPIPSSQNIYYTAWVAKIWHETGGHLCINNTTSAVLIPTNPPTLANCPMFYMLAFMKSIIDKVAATPAIKTYMQRGWRMRPLEDSWYGDLIESGDTLAAYLASNVTDTWVNHSIWLNPSADSDFASTSNCIGIVITSHDTNDHTLNLYMQSEAYDLSPTSVKVLYTRVGNVRTEVTRFTDVLDYDITVAFDGSQAAVLLYEVVQLA